MFSVAKVIGLLLVCSTIFIVGFKAGASGERSECLSDYKTQSQKQQRAYLVELKDAQKRLKIESDKTQALNRALVIQAKKTQSIQLDYINRLHQLKGVLNEQDVKNWGSVVLPNSVLEWLHKLQKDRPSDHH